MPSAIRGVHWASDMAGMLGATKAAKHTLEYKYNNLLRFRSLANSRIATLKQILPEQYRMEDFILFNCIYFSQDNVLTLAGVHDERYGSVEVEQTKVLQRGRRLLKMRLRDRIFEDLRKKQGAEHELFETMGPSMKMTREISDNMLLTQFVNQFLRRLDQEGKLDVRLIGGKPAPIKFEQTSRRKIIPALIGFMQLQLPPGRSEQFIDEFVLDGRGTKGTDYTHKGLIEIWKEKKHQALY